LVERGPAYACPLGQLVEVHPAAFRHRFDPPKQSRRLAGSRPAAWVSLAYGRHI
jgi:hypothetical protein